MFDRYLFESPSSVREVNITEKRAPTDDSVRLLKEMEAAVMAKMVASVNVANTHFECVVHGMIDHLNDKVDFVAVFKVNGHKMEARTSVRSGTPIEEVAVKVRDSVAIEVANLIAPLFDDSFVRQFGIPRK